MPEKRKPRVIKRYANRKLYDMSESCYITHDEIAALVENGEEVKIIDNRTKEDLTSRTLTQILFEKEKRDRRTLPLATLRGIFETGGTFFQKHIAQPVTNLRDEAEETVRKVLRPRSTEPSEPPLKVKTRESTGSRQKPADAFREWLEQSQMAVDNLQRTLEERWNLVLKSLGHFDKNHRRINELEERVAELEQELANLRREKRS